jgi:periplasmic divalent cation tolerance protein
MVSVYIWKGTRHRDAEVVLIAKTREALAGRLIKEARARHSYDNPAFLVLPVEGGSEPYLDWIATQTSAPRPAEHE